MGHQEEIIFLRRSLSPSKVILRASISLSARDFIDVFRIFIFIISLIPPMLIPKSFNSKYKSRSHLTIYSMLFQRFQVLCIQSQRQIIKKFLFEFLVVFKAYNQQEFIVFIFLNISYNQGIQTLLFSISLEQSKACYVLTPTLYQNLLSESVVIIFDRFLFNAQYSMQHLFISFNKRYRLLIMLLMQLKLILLWQSFLSIILISIMALFISKSIHSTKYYPQKYWLQSQEIGHQCPIVFTLRTLRHSLENNVVFVSILIKVQDSGLVIHPVAVVRGRPQGHKLFIKPVYISFLDQLMGPDNKIEVIQQIEVIDYLMPKYPSCSSRIPSPSLNILRIRPHEISHWSLIGNFLLPIEKSHLVDGGEVGRQSSMYTEDVSVDNGPKGEEVKGLIEILPAIGVAVFFIDLVKEAIHHGDVPAFVVAPQQVDAIGILDLQAEEEGDGLD